MRGLAMDRTVTGWSGLKRGGVALFCALAASSASRAAVPTGEVRLSNGTVEVVVVPALGRIMRYGYVGEGNQLWTLPGAEAYASKVGNWNNWGGDKAWIWPQEDWKPRLGASWPPPADCERMERVPGDPATQATRLRIETAPVASYGVRIVRELELEPHGTELTVRTWLEPVEGAADPSGLPFAAWTITQVPARNEGLYARPVAPEAAWTPLGTGGALPPPIPIPGTRTVRVPRDASVSGKSGFDGDAFAVRRGDVLFVQRALPFQGPVEFAAGERAQVYATPDVAAYFPPDIGPYVELELTAPRVPRERVREHGLVVVWSLHRLPAGADDAWIGRLLDNDGRP